MEINGERLIATSQQAVWDAINDPQMLRLCIPGCEGVERVDDSQMKAVVMAKIGPVRARFSGKVSMSDVVAPTSCTLNFEGTGGPAGFAKGQAKVVLTAQGENQTLLVFSASAAVGGKLGQIGARLIEGAARSISDEFFNHLMVQLAPPVAVAIAAAPVAPAAEGSPAQPAVPASARPVAAAGPVAAAESWLHERWVMAVGCTVLGFIVAKIF